MLEVVMEVVVDEVHEKVGKEAEEEVKVMFEVVLGSEMMEAEGIDKALLKMDENERLWMKWVMKII